MSHDNEPARGSSSSAADLVPGLRYEPEAPDAPEDVEALSRRFDLVLGRGYDRRQVDEHVERLLQLITELRAEVADLSKREAAAATEAARVRAELQRGRPGFDALGERVTQMLSLAETEAAELREAAEREVAQLREDAAQESAQVREDAYREAAQVREEAYAEAVALREQVAQKVTSLTEQTQLNTGQQRAQAEEDARVLRETAQRQAAELRATVERDVEALLQRRGVLLAELTRTRDTIDGILTSAAEGRLEPEPEPEPTGDETVTISLADIAGLREDDRAAEGSTAGGPVHRAAEQDDEVADCEKTTQALPVQPGQRA